jgi:predicted P-loop ATPase
MVAAWSDGPQVPKTAPGAEVHSTLALQLAEPPAIVSSLLGSESELAAAWASGAKLTRGKGQSGSGLDYSLMVWLASRGHDDATIEAALRAYPHGQIGRLDDARANRRVKDLLREAAKRRDRAAQVREAAPWLDDLILGTNGPLDNVANVGIALAAEPMLGGAIHLDELRGCPVVASTPWRAGPSYREWTDTDDIALAEWLQLRGLNVKPTTCAAAVQYFAATRPIHPLRDHLDHPRWDGQARLDQWLIAYLGVADSPYARAVGRAWMVQAVARVYRPGCKADHALILEGPQGAFKSTACAIMAIAPEFFADEIADLGSKDSAQDLRGKWIIEIGESSALRRSEVERVKAFISRTVDHYRPSYGRRSQDFPRSCVFIGTTNADTYLADETGGRRFWPVKVGTVDVECLRRDTAQLWAEAVCAFKAGEVWHLPRDLEMRARDEQADRRIADPWEQAVITWAKDKPGPVTIGDALHYAVGLELGRRTQGDENRVARIFKAHGWERVQLRVAGERVWHYRRPSPVLEPTAEQADAGRIANVFAMAGRSTSPVSPVAGGTSGDGKASKTAAVTTVTTVTSSFETSAAVTGSPHGAATGMPASTGKSAMESGNMPVTPVTVVTAAESLAKESPVASGDGAFSGDGDHGWDDLDHWRYRLSRAGPSRDARQQVVLDWGSSAGGTVDTTGEHIELTLPVDLPDSYASRELKRLARDLSLMPKVLFPPAYSPTRP